MMVPKDKKIVSNILSLIKQTRMIFKQDFPRFSLLLLIYQEICGFCLDPSGFFWFDNSNIDMNPKMPLSQQDQIREQTDD